MALRPCFCLLAALLLCHVAQPNRLGFRINDLEPVRQIPEIVRAYPFMLRKYPAIFDFLLGVASEYVYSNNLDRVTVPSVAKSVTITVAGISYSTTFTGTHGWMQDLSTLTRTSNVTVVQNRPGSVSLSTSISFRSLTVGFDKYTLPLGKFTSLSGNLNIKINNNRIGIKMLIVNGRNPNKCSFALEDLQIEELDDIHATITGLYPFNWIYSIIVNMIIKDNNSVVRGFLEGKFSVEARDFIMQLPCGR